MAADVAAGLVKRQLSARTVTTKLRYSDFSIRSRSTTLAAPIDEAERIAELACRLLDRGLRDRPGALRLVGVGVSGLSEHRQLTLEYEEQAGACPSDRRPRGAAAASGRSGRRRRAARCGRPCR